MARHFGASAPSGLRGFGASGLRGFGLEDGMASAPLRFGLVGTGYWARITHAPALAAAPDIEVAAAAARFGSSLEEASPYNTPWRREKGALWDIAPHAVSLLWAALGPVTAVTADAGPADVSHLILHHEGGASSTVTVSQCGGEA